MSTTNFKNSVVVTATDPRGKTVSKAFSNVNPNASAFEIQEFSRAATALTDNTLTGAHVVRTFPVVDGNKIANEGTSVVKLQARWNGQTYTGTDFDDTPKFTVKSTDDGVQSFGDHKYFFSVPVHLENQNKDFFVECDMLDGVKPGFSADGAATSNNFRYAVHVFIDASDANKSSENTSYDADTGRWKVWFSVNGNFVYASCCLNFDFEEVL